MQNNRDEEIDTMRKEKGISILQISNVIGKAYNTTVQRLNGFLPYKPGEREKIIKFIQDYNNESTEMRKI